MSAELKMIDYGTASSPPTSEVFSDEIDSISTQDNSLLRESISKHNNNNFKIGYMPVCEPHLKNVPKGRKTFAFWTLVGLLYILAIGNLLLTMTIMAVLKIGKGMQNIEVIPEDDATRLFGNIDLGHLYKRDGLFEGYEEDSVEVESEDSSIIFNISDEHKSTTKIIINSNATLFRGFNKFEVKSKHGNTIFTTKDTAFKSIKNANNLITKQIETNRVSSPVDEDLRIEADVISIKGSEGTNLDGKDVVWSADQDIFLKTINGSIVISGKEGTFIDVNRLPIANLKNANFATAQFKVCVCMPQGKLFRIPVTSVNERVFCHHVSLAPQNNPCI